jgi:hypothetical protein
LRRGPLYRLSGARQAARRRIGGWCAAIAPTRLPGALRRLCHPRDSASSADLSGECRTRTPIESRPNADTAKIPQVERAPPGTHTEAANVVDGD